jgi:hypothetical protein
MALRATRLASYALALGAAACHGSPKPEVPPEPSEHALSGLAAEHVVVLPAYSVHVTPGLDWTSAIGRSVDVQRTLDADLLAALDERGLRKTWIFPDDLRRSYQRNSSYAADPYTLAEEPLRSPSLALDARLPDPLASQLRTLVALHEGARLILAPVDLRLERAGAGGRGVLRLVLLDSRASNVRWIGEITSDTTSTFSPAISASLASKLAKIVSP